MKRPFAGLAAAVCAAMLAGGAWAASDRLFLRQAMEADNSEIRLAALAEQRAVSPAFRAFARVLREDHTLAKDQAYLMARQLGLPPTDVITAEAVEGMKALGRLNGRAFEAAFVRYIIGDHQRLIALFQQEAVEGKGNARRLAEQALPTLRKHLFTAQALQAGR